MRKYNNILVVVEPKRERQVALERAIELGQYNPNITITVLRLIYDFSYDIHILNRRKALETRDDVSASHLEGVKALIAEYAENSTVKLVPKVAWARDLGQSIVDEMNSGAYDLLIKGANHHGVLDSIIFTPVDWYVLRNAQIPVIIAKEHAWQEHGNIMVALDFTSEQKRLFNVHVLREAQMLARVLHGTIHLVNSAPVILPTIMLEAPNYAPEIYAENVVKEHRRRLLEFAAQHQIPAEQCHIEEGMPDDVIPRMCAKLKPQAVFIGSAGRQGVSAALIGNTCEEIVDYIDADLFVLNHQVKEKPADQE